MAIIMIPSPVMIYSLNSVVIFFDTFFLKVPAPSAYLTPNKELHFVASFIFF